MCMSLYFVLEFENIKFEMVGRYGVYSDVLFSTVFGVNVVDFLQHRCASCSHLEPAAHLVTKKSEAIGTKEITMTRPIKKLVF